MKFCPECAHPISFITPPDDNRPRHVCIQCGAIHYQNPKMVLGSIPVWENESDGEVRVLLCKRAIQPRHGYWTLPAGFMENDETTAEAAIRETVEEAGAEVKLHELFTLLNVVHAHQVHMFYRATLLNLNYKAGTESLEVKLFTEKEIPWDEIAFPTVTHTLKCFFADWNAIKSGIQGGVYSFHTHDVARSTHYTS